MFSPPFSIRVFHLWAWQWLIFLATPRRCAASHWAPYVTAHREGKEKTARLFTGPHRRKHLGFLKQSGAGRRDKGSTTHKGWSWRDQVRRTKRDDQESLGHDYLVTLRQRFLQKRKMVPTSDRQPAVNGTQLMTVQQPWAPECPPGAPAQGQSPSWKTGLTQKHCLDIPKHWQNKRLWDLCCKVNRETMRFKEKYWNK